MRGQFRQYGGGYLIAVIATALVALVRFSFKDVFGDRAPMIPFVVPVIIAAAYGGLKPGLLATVLSSLLIHYLFLPPLFSFRLPVALTGDAVAIGLFVIS